ncbi:MAG: DNA polymerase III subunit delta [Saprospiraceae bacterium]|nr:DNA polymerase III subunit delta [Saprospiraceae bacterium]
MSTYDSIIEDLQQKKYKNIYFLYGEEPYYIDKLADFIDATVLTESEKAFNQIVVYGKDADFKTIVDECRQYPMMAERRLVILKEGQNMTSINELQNYLEKPSDLSMLVICYKYKKPDKRTKFYKAIEKNGVLFESKPIYDNQVAPWIGSYLKAKGFSIDPGAADMMAEYVGKDLHRLSNELDKICVGRDKKSAIDIKCIKDEIGISKDYSIFDLQSALSEKNFAKSTRIIRNFINNPKNNPTVMVLSGLHSYFFKVFITLAFRNENDFELQKN